MTIKHILVINFLLITYLLNSQNFKGVYKIDELTTRLDNRDTTFVVNFWATWCKPCIEELPAFDSLNLLKKNTSVKIILVSLDFKEELEKKVKPFLHKHKIQTECYLLDEVNGNDFINKLSAQWTGAIPATLFKQEKKKKLVEKKMKLAELLLHIKELN